MKRDNIDFHTVQAEHEVVHSRLKNWARWVTVRDMHWIAPIWKLGKSNGRQWDEPVLRAEVDTLDAAEIEKAVRRLPEKHRAAVRWAYVFKRNSPAKTCRELGVNMQGLDALMRSGRTMLKNTS